MEDELEGFRVVAACLKSLGVTHMFGVVGIPVVEVELLAKMLALQQLLLAKMLSFRQLLLAKMLGVQVLQAYILVLVLLMALMLEVLELLPVGVVESYTVLLHVAQNFGMIEESLQVPLQPTA